MLFRSRAGLIEDIILTPFSWTDSEIEHYIDSRPLAFGTVKSTTCVIVNRKRIVTTAELEKIVAKDKKKRSAETLEKEFKIETRRHILKKDIQIIE